MLYEYQYYNNVLTSYKIISDVRWIVVNRDTQLNFILSIDVLTPYKIISDVRWIVVIHN